MLFEILFLLQRELARRDFELPQQVAVLSRLLRVQIQHAHVAAVAAAVVRLRLCGRHRDRVFYRRRLTFRREEGSSNQLLMKLTPPLNFTKWSHDNQVR